MNTPATYHTRQIPGGIFQAALTLPGPTILVLSVKHATLTLLHDTSPGGTNLFYVTVTIDGAEHHLGTYDDLRTAARRMGDWVRQRGFTWDADSTQRLNAAYRTDGPVLILNAHRMPHQG